MEDLAISPPGKAPDDILNGFYDLDGELPCQSDGRIEVFWPPHRRLGATHALRNLQPAAAALA